MQGYILQTRPMKNEDLLVFILCKDAFIATYRFYGLRHSVLLSGVKIDFALEKSAHFLPRLKDVLGLNYIANRQDALIWQDFMRLLYQHLRQSSSLDGFYFDLVDLSFAKLGKQDAKRIVIDAYMKLLVHEGRLDESFVCFACNEAIKGREIGLVRGFLCAHKECVPTFCFDKTKLKAMHESLLCKDFEDEDINNLYILVKEGF